MKTALFTAAALLALGACTEIYEPAEPVLCPANIPTAVILTVQDSVTGANATPGATIVLRDGLYAETVVGLPGASGVSLGANRTGTFTVTVSQSAYRTWTKTGVDVKKGPCGAVTVELTARLKPAT